MEIDRPEAILQLVRAGLGLAVLPSRLLEVWSVGPEIVRPALPGLAPVRPVRSWGIARIRFHRSWPKAAVTIPFLPVVVSVGPPIRVPSATEDARPYQIAVSRSIADLAKWASAWAHVRFPSTKSSRCRGTAATGAWPAGSVVAASVIAVSAA